MKTFLLLTRNYLCAAAMAFVGAAAVSPAQAEITTQAVTLYSPALDMQTTYIAALPSPMVAGQKYPVLYLLHGATGSYKDWMEKTTVSESLKNREMIVITPDGGKYGWYIDSPLQAKSQYASFITKDLRADVEKRFPARTDRQGRGIAGLSMGGHGALSLAAKNPGLYGSASSLSGILDISAHPQNWKLGEILGAQPEALDQWKANSVYYLAEAFTTAGVALRFDTGTEDTTGAVDDSRRFHEKLEELKVPHIYNEYPGKHNWEYWQDHIAEHLDFHEQVFQGGEDRGE